MAKRFIGGDTSVAPAGSIQAFAGANVPHGWLLCDGSVKDISEFPALAAALDGTWDSFAHPVDGTPSVGAGQFAVPNMKGLYLSGAGNAGGDARSLGVFQGDATAKNGLSATSGNDTHSHSAGTLKGRRSSAAGADNVSGRASSKNNQGSTTYDIAISGSTASDTHNHTINIGNGDSETRPKTAPVNYIIKY